MKTVKRFAKRTLSLVLCLAMVLTTVIFFEIGILKPKADVGINNPAAADLADVLFYVPEAIYLRPVSHSWGANSKSKFHFFVENKVLDSSGNLMSQPEAKADITTGNGKVYFKYANGTFKNLEIRWLTNDLSSTYNDGGDLILPASGGSESAAGGMWAEISRDMESPTLAAGVNGCILEWKLTYHDNADNLDKAVVAYSYVYKPYVVAITTGIKAKETFWSDHEIQHISWISGIHNVVSEATSGQRYARYGASARTGNKGFMPFLTSGNLDGINGSSATGSHFGVKDGASPIAGANTLNAYFASTNTSYDYFYADQSQNNNNQNAWDWHVDSGNQSMTTTESGTSSVNKAVHVYSDIERDPGGVYDACVFKSYVNTSVGGIYIDTSRYIDLYQVPNLGVGLRVTKSEGADGGSWYVGDFTDRSQDTDYYGSDRSTRWNSYMENIWTNVNYSIAGAGNKKDVVGQGAWCETKYAGTWPKVLENYSQETYTKTYKIKMVNYAHKGDDGTMAASIMQLQAKQYNKANLRAAVYNAEREFSRLGVYDNNYNSHYYKYEGAYKAFIEAYKSAYASLIYVDMAPTSNPDTLATNLNNALATLKADTACRKTGKAYQYNVGVIRNENGTYRIVPIPGATQPEKQFYLRDKVTFTAETYTGYTFLGMYKMESKFTLETFYDESYDVIAVPEQTHSGNRKNVRVSQDSSAKTTSFTTLDSISTSTEVAVFDDSSKTVTYNYAYDTDITYVYFYEINNNDVIFGNEFDFDKFRWTGVNQGTKVVDHVNNTVTLNSTSSATDAYTTSYDKNQKGYMTLIPGRVYEYSCTVKNNTASASTASMFLFTFPSDPSSATSPGLGSDRTDFTSTYIDVAANGTGTITGTLTIPAGRPYATIRVGSYTPNTSLTFSNICVRDITTFTTPLLTNDVDMPDPLYKTGLPGASVTGFPAITRPGYVFAGWSTDREANGNGAAANMVTSVAVPANGNETLYPVWQTNVIYALDGGLYRKSSDPMQTSHQVEGRWNVAIGTSVPVSNRVVQGQTGWDSIDVGYSYVPYKPGKNFKGWLANSVDPAVNGKVYWPTEPVVTNANVEFTAVWEDAMTVTFDESVNKAEGYVTSSQNNGKFAFYPGQVHFFSYTAPRAQYATAYTSNNRGSDLEMQAFDGSLNFIMENDNREYNYGITGIKEYDPAITMNLEGGKKYYAGVTMHSLAGYTAEGTDFTIQEHTVKYTLLPNGGTINGSNQPQTVTGYSNIDTVLPSTGEKYGYDFSGWLSEETPAKNYASGEKVPGADNYNRINGFTESLVRDIYLTAQWTPKPFNLIYDENIPTGENVTPTKDDVKGMPSSGTLRYNTIGYVSENTPTMPGYTFKGWATTAEKAEGEKLYQKSEEISATLATKFFDDNNGGAVTLYARWSPNLIIVRFNPSVGSTGGFEKSFYYDQPQKVDPQDIAPEKYTVKFFNSNDLVNPVDTKTADLVFDGWQDVQTGTPTYTYADGSIIKNPNGVTGKSDTEAVYTDLYAKWRGGEGTTEVEVPLWFDGSVAEGEKPDVLIGFAESPNATEAVYEAGERFVPTGDMNLYAVWYTPEAANDKIEDFKQYEEKVEVVKGIKYTNTDLTEYETIKDIGIPTHNVQAYLEKVQALTNASNALKNYPTAANNKAYYEALKAVEEAERPAELDPITTYLTNFKIEYADGVTGKVKEGTYSLADMNLNHYTTDVIEIAAAAAKAATDGITGMTKQSTINESVITMARAYANKQNVKIGTPTYNVYDTAKSIEESGLTSATGIEAMNYVYTGKDDYTYYCYTSSEKPVMYITVDEILADVNDRICYPTTAVTEGDIVMTRGALTENPIYTKIEDKASKDRYADYLEEGIGTAYASKYSEKAVIELRPDFTEVNDDAKNATVKYTFKAYDDAFAGLNNENPHYANSAKLASGEEKGNLEEIVRKDTTVTPENTITIIIDYHQGDELNVTSDQVNQDQWLKQFHLFRDSGGASNWELPVTGDTVYTVDDKTYGQTDYGSFTYTFEVGTENIANCVLASANVNDVIATVKAHYGEMKEVAFTGTNKEGGSGLGYKAWGSSWSFNYYPKSNAYTYVHLVDRWGNVVDKVIEVPDLDAKKAEVTVQSAGQVTVIEDGGSGIGTMSLSAKTFDIITDENSIFNGESYTTSSNVIKVYTGEANKKYTLEANDVATNKATAEVTTDTEGYLTITVEDKAFDTESGAYTFTLNGMEINLYAEVEKKVISATSEPVEKGQTAIVEIVTTSKVETVQLVSEIGTTTTISKYTEDEDGNRVWTAKKNKEVGEYEYKIRFKAEGSWTTEGDKVTVTVTEPIIFVGAVTKVEYTPSTSARNDYMFTVTGRPDKIQVIEPSGGTRTYDRYHVKVVIVSYDAEGNVVGATSRELSYEVWTIVGMNVPADMELTAVAKYGKTWSKDAPYKYTVILATPEYDDEVYSMSLERTGGLLGKVKATVVTGLDVQGVRFVMEDKTTTTYYTAIAEADGKKTFVGNAWMNHGGDNIIVVKIRVNNKWYEAGELSYYAI